MEDLEPADIKTDDGGNTTMSKPRVSRQFEVGVRKNWGQFRDDPERSKSNARVTGEVRLIKVAA